jgi:hypothetical protein
MIGARNIPASYDYINAYNHQYAPSTIHVKETGLSWYFKRYLIQKIISVFKFDGIPDTWAKDYFLYTLFVFGYCAVINTNKYGVIPQHCTLSGYNIFYRPNKAIIANPLFNRTIEAKIGIDCELIRMAPDWCGVWDIVEYYADLMALTSETIAGNLINSKFSYVFAAEDKASAESLKKLYDQIASGEPAAFADKKLFTDDGDPSWYLFVQNLKQNYIAGDLLEDLAKIDSRFNTEIGIPNVNIAKASGVGEAEVMANNIDTHSKAALWLETIQDSLKKVNEMFDLDITVSMRFSGEEVLSNE